MAKRRPLLRSLGSAMLGICLTTGAADGQLIGIAISKTADTNFGKVFTTPSAGTVTVTPAGTRTATGGALLGSGVTVSAARFTVSGQPLSTYAITLPGSVTISNGGATMTVNSFTSNPSGSGTLGLGGSQTLRVGATLQVGASQLSGSYSGTYMVRVDYN